MQHCTLCLLFNNNKLLLGLKKQGLGKGLFNGFGGKVENGESIEQAAIRELQEEAGITAHAYRKVGILDFEFPQKPGWNQKVHVFVVHEWTGTPIETEEMKPEWFNINQLPYSQMWEADTHWLPVVLGKKYVIAKFVYSANQKILEKEVNSL